MKRVIFFLSFLLLLLLAIPKIVFALNSNLTDPAELPAKNEALKPEIIQARDTHFEITDSPYLNIIVDSSQTITLNAQSVLEMITLDFEAEEDYSSTEITLSGLKANTTYHKYQDGYENHEVLTTDGSGKLEFTQDLSTLHHVFLQTKPSTKTIDASATGLNCPLIGTWNYATLTCTLNKNVNESIYITGTGVTLDGNGYTVSAGTSAYGVYISNRNNITVKNLIVKNCSTGIYLYNNVSGITVTNNTIKDNSYAGIYLSANAKNSNIIGNTITNNLGPGISISSNSTNNTFSGNTITGNGNYSTTTKMPGVDINAAFNTFTNNTISDNWDSGIKIGPSGYITITNNTINNNRNAGIYFNNGNGSVVQNNTISENDLYDIYINATFVSHCSETINNNTGSGGRPIGFYNTAGTISGGNYSQLIVCGVSGANINNVSVEGSTTKKNNGFYLIKSDHSNLSNINSSGNKYGVYFYNSNYNTLTPSAGLNDNLTAVYLDASHFNSISGGVISNNDDGLILYISNSNTISGNSVINNRKNGIYLTYRTGHSPYVGSDSNIISSNVITNNASIATRDENYYGLMLEYSKGNILRNNDIHSNTYNFGMFSWETAHLDNDVDNTNLSGGKPILILKNATNQVIDGSTVSASSVYCINCNNVTVKNFDFHNEFTGVYFHRSTNCQAENITVTQTYVNFYGQYSSGNRYLNNTTSDSRYGILFSPYGGCASGTCKDNIVKDNESSGNYYGFYFNADTTVLTGNFFHDNYYGVNMYGPNSLVRNNTISKNEIGMRSVAFTNNTVYNNNFLSNTKQTEISNVPLLNLPVPDGGNFWSEWTTPDANSDGFVDSPYIISPTVLDNLPWTIENGWLPKTTISFTGDEGNDGWFKSNVTVSFNIVDNNSIAKTEYRFNNGIWNTYSGPFEITNEGELKIYYRSVDSNGDTEKTKEASVKIDKTPPTITLEKSPEPNTNGWNNTGVTVNFVCEDNLSGIQSCSSPITVSTEGADQSVTGTVTDKAGNTTTQIIGGINIDKTAPLINIVSPEQGKEYILKENLIADWEASDPLSGLDSASGTVADGETIDTNTIGAKEFSVAAKDKAGNEAGETVNYKVIYAFSGLLEPVKDKEYKAGSTIPLKFQLKDANGGFITNAVAKIYLIDSNGTEIPGIPAGNANEENIFRDAGDKYIFNLKTKGLSAGSWQIKIVLDDGSNKIIPIIFK